MYCPAHTSLGPAPSTEAVWLHPLMLPLCQDGCQLQCIIGHGRGIALLLNTLMEMAIHCRHYLVEGLETNVDPHVACQAQADQKVHDDTHVQPHAAGTTQGSRPQG